MQKGAGGTGKNQRPKQQRLLRRRRRQGRPCDLGQDHEEEEGHDEEDEEREEDAEAEQSKEKEESKPGSAVAKPVRNSVTNKKDWDSFVRSKERFKVH